MSVEQDLLLNVMLSTHSQPFHGIYVVRQTLLFLPFGSFPRYNCAIFSFIILLHYDSSKNNNKIGEKKGEKPKYSHEH